VSRPLEFSRIHDNYRVLHEHFSCKNLLLPIISRIVADHPIQSISQVTTLTYTSTTTTETDPGTVTLLYPYVNKRSSAFLTQAQYEAAGLPFYQQCPYSALSVACQCLVQDPNIQTLVTSVSTSVVATVSATSTSFSYVSLLINHTPFETITDINRPVLAQQP
jgi:hypothetical protein